MLKRILLAVLIAVTALPLSAQERNRNSYLFRFVPGRDMFYVPFGGNAGQLDSLLSELTKNMEQLRGGERYICVSSYGASPNDTLTASRMAYLRSHRVKSELITRGGVTEAMFVTDRHIAAPYGDTLRDVVVVTFPAGVEKVAELAGEEAAAKVDAYNRKVSGEAGRERLAAGERRQAEQAAMEKAEAERLAKEQAEQKRIADEKAAEERAEAERRAAEQQEQDRLAAEEQARLQAGEAARAAVERPGQERTATEQAGRAQPGSEAQATPYHLALRANLLRWATLTPDLGVEWRINRHVGIAVNGSWTSWTWNGKERRYALWEVNPEVRWYLGKEKRGYVGAMYKVGSFNYKFSETGRQGDLMGGGITGGYQLKLNNALSLDFSLGLGYVNADYEKYTVIDGVRVRCGKETKNWWGPTQAGVTLVWTIF